MDEVILIAIIVSLGALFIVAYVIVYNYRKNLRFEKVNEQVKKIISDEKELDKTEAIKRGLHLYTGKKQKIV